MPRANDATPSLRAPLKIRQHLCRSQQAPGRDSLGAGPESQCGWCGDETRDDESQRTLQAPQALLQIWIVIREPAAQLHLKHGKDRPFYKTRVFTQAAAEWPIS
jgi:hypothetical protein